MFEEFISINIPSLLGSLPFVFAVILSVAGFIGNININSSDGGQFHFTNAEGTTISSDDIESMGKFTEIIDVNDIQTLQITNPLGKIIINKADEPKITIEKEIFILKETSSERKEAIKKQVNTDCLELDGATAKLDIPPIKLSEGMNVAITLEILMPQDINVHVMPGVNQIIINDRAASLDLSNNVGNIDVKRFEGSLKAHTNSGGIVCHDIKGPMTISTNAGNISLSSLVFSGNSEISSKVGNILLDIIENKENAVTNIVSNTGQVDILANRDADIAFDLSTKMGQIEIDPSIEKVSEEKSFMGGSMKAKLNNGGGIVSVISNMGRLKVAVK